MANDPDFNVYMDLQPGEMQFINNYHVLHGRTPTKTMWPHGYKRHLKRLWLATYALDGPAGALRGARAAQHWEAKRSVSSAAGGGTGSHRVLRSPARVCAIDGLGGGSTMHDLTVAVTAVRTDGA